MFILRVSMSSQMKSKRKEDKQLTSLLSTAHVARIGSKKTVQLCSNCRNGRFGVNSNISARNSEVEDINGSSLHRSRTRRLPRYAIGRAMRGTRYVVLAQRCGLPPWQRLEIITVLKLCTRYKTTSRKLLGPLMNSQFSDC